MIGVLVLNCLPSRISRGLSPEESQLQSSMEERVDIYTTVTEIVKNGYLLAVVVVTLFNTFWGKMDGSAHSNVFKFRFYLYVHVN